MAYVRNMLDWIFVDIRYWWILLTGYLEYNGLSLSKISIKFNINEYPISINIQQKI